MCAALAAAAEQRNDAVWSHDPLVRHHVVGALARGLTCVTALELAAALQTIIEVGDKQGLDDAVAHAFPGAELNIAVSRDATFLVELTMPGVQRPFSARELSDGTLRYLCLLAALLSPARRHCSS